jgi:hypothetical protein
MAFPMARNWEIRFADGSPAILTRCLLQERTSLIQVFVNMIQI